MFSVFKPEALHERPIPERHRIIFYLGHLEAFDWNLIGSGRFALPSFNKEFDQLFAFGIDPIDGNLPQDRPGDWPAKTEILRYNAAVRETIDEYLERESDDQRVCAATEHRLMHAETLAYLMHALPPGMKSPPPLPAIPIDTRAIDSHSVEISAGEVTLGKNRHDGTFGWDNEFDAHQVRVPSFAMDKYKVSNAQFLAFIDAGGYQERSLWSNAAWEWISGSGVHHPRFWDRNGKSWVIRTMFEPAPFQPNWPVYVSYAEAEAFARWRGKSLPTEAQFHRAAFGSIDSSEERDYPWGSDSPRRIHGNFDGQEWNPTPVDAHPGGDSAFGVSGLVGNGWEWTGTPFAPFPGFRPFDFYKEYSANFFDGEHYVLKGGSPRTASVLLRRSFRNWFQPRYPNIYASFRCVEN